LQRTAGNGPGQRRRAQRQAAHHQVHASPGRSPCGNPATDPHAQMLERLGVEQVIAPAPVEQRQVAGRRIAGAKTVQLEHGFYAALLALANRFAQLLGSLLFGGFFAGHAASASGAVDQQFGNQAQGAVLAGFTLGLLVGNQSLQRAPRMLQQQRQAFI